MCCRTDRSWTCEHLNSYPLICTPVSKVTKAWPTSCCCEQTPGCCRICQFRAAPNIQGLQGFCRPNAAASIHMCVAEIKPAPKGRNSIRASPTNCYCQHTHVCRRMEHLEFHPRIKGYKGSPDHLLQRAYTCVFQNKSNQGCTQGSICYKGPAAKVLL